MSFDNFSNLTITCDGKHTRVVVDGLDISRGCTRVVFEHDTEKDFPISLKVDISPNQKESDPDATEAEAGINISPDAIARIVQSAISDSTTDIVDWAHKESI